MSEEEFNFPMLAKIIERAEMLDNDSSMSLHEKGLLLAEFIEQGRRPRSGGIAGNNVDASRLPAVLRTN